MNFTNKQDTPKNIVLLIWFDEYMQNVTSPIRRTRRMGTQMFLSESIAAYTCYPHQVPLPAPLWVNLPAILR